MPSDNTATIIIIAAIVIVTLYYMFSSSGPIHNEGSLHMGDKKTGKHILIDSDADTLSSYLSDDCSSYTDMGPRVSDRQKEADDSVDSSIEIIAERAIGRDGMYKKRKNGGRYVHDSYRSLDSGRLKNSAPNFKIPDVTKNYTDRFVPIEECSEGAPINLGPSYKNDNDKYNVNSYLPQEEEKDWFETIETVNVKNSHLINIYRPIGVNTIGSTHKNSTYDLRGTDKAVCPKFVVSPWLQSSIEPDRSMKSLCGF